MGNTVKHEIAQNIFWVGIKNENGILQCNPYLLTDGDEAVLFDPGSVLDYDGVIRNIKEIIPLKKIKYVVIHHQDPDLCSAIPLFEKEGARFKIVTHWRTKVMVKYYGIKSDYYLVDENDYSLKLKSGREIKFLPAPYLHFPGAITSYDGRTKTLLSGDLFGSLASDTELYADDEYMEGMIEFHRHYMPSNQILRPVMENLLLIDIDRIAPQHGSIIQSNVEDYIKVLRDLECGIFLDPVKKSITDLGGYKSICSIILKRYTSLYSNSEIQEAIEGLDVKMGSRVYEIEDYNCTGLELWHNLFEAIYKNKGLKWIFMVEPLVRKICKEYDMPVPDIINSELTRVQGESMILKQEMDELKEQNQNVSENIAQTSGRIIQCPVTGLYNEEFFFEYIRTVVDAPNKIKKSEASIILISIDDLPRIKLAYGQEEYDSTLKSVTYILKQIRRHSHMLFRLNSGNFAYLGNNFTKDEIVNTAEKIRNEIKNSKKFIENLTVSVGVAHYDDVKGLKVKHGRDSDKLYEAAVIRMRIAKNRGGDFVVNDTDIKDLEYGRGKILIADSDVTNVNILKAYLTNRDYNVITAFDGEQAAEIAAKELPALIVSEAILPKLDGFVLKEKLAADSSTKNIAFILVSNLKDEDSVKRAFGLGIEHYLKKPYMVTEILGIIDLKLRERKQ